MGLVQNHGLMASHWAGYKTKKFIIPLNGNFLRLAIILKDVNVPFP